MAQGHRDRHPLLLLVSFVVLFFRYLKSKFSGAFISGGRRNNVCVWERVVGKQGAPTFLFFIVIKTPVASAGCLKLC